MTKVWLSLHVLAAIICIGPVTVAASIFPRYVRTSPGEPGDGAIAASLHRITRVYAVLGVSVPALGFATAAALGVLGDAWLIAAITLTAIAAVVLVGLIIPGQMRLLAGEESATSGGPQATPNRAAATRLAMQTGIFNLLWAVVVVLMIVRPGSTTGA